MKGKLAGGITFNRDGTQNVTFTVDEDFTGAYDELKDKDLEITVKIHHKRRSLDSNAYCWTLIDKIAAKTGSLKTEVYREAIRDIPGVSYIGCFQNDKVQGVRECWHRNGMGWITDTMPSKLDGCTNIIFYYGSSIYDTWQMGKLIDRIVEEAQALGIETMPPEQVKSLNEFSHRRRT